MKIQDKQKSMYIIQNLETKELDIATNLLVVSKLTQIPINKMHHVFSRKKEIIFEYLQYKIYKKILYSSKNEKRTTLNK